MVKVTIENNNKVNTLKGSFALGATCSEGADGNMEASVFLNGTIDKKEFPRILADIVFSILESATEEESNTYTAGMMLMFEAEAKKHGNAYIEEHAGRL